MPKDKCTIFISRMTDDSEIFSNSPGDIQDQLLQWSPNLNIVDAKAIGEGDNWRDFLQEQISKASIFLIIHTKSATAGFDWPLYEAGLYDGIRIRDNTRLICMYPQGDTPPEPLKHLQGIPAIEADIVDFLTKLYHDKKYTDTNQALNERLSVSKFTEKTEQFPKGIAREICDRINGVSGTLPTYVQRLTPYMELTIPAGKKLGPEGPCCMAQ